MGLPSKPVIDQTSARCSSMPRVAARSSPAVFVLSFVLGLIANKVWAWLNRKGRQQQHAITAAQDQQSQKSQAPTQKQIEENEVFMREQLTRNVQFYGEDGNAKVRGSFVVVVGLGGVGSHAAHMLVRAGVGRMRLIDLDNVSLSSLNRSAVAFRPDVGRPKAEVLRSRFLDINPCCRIEPRFQAFTKDVAESLIYTDLNGKAGVKPDFVIDCIDNIETKIDLLEFCLRHHIRVVSSGGAGGRSDPTALQIADILESKGPDPMLPVGRLPMIFSTEKAKPLLPLETHQEEDPEQYRVFGGSYRIRTIPVLGPIPAVFGQSMASFAICELAGEPLTAPAGRDRVNKKEVTKMFGDCVSREVSRYGSKPGVRGAPCFDLEDAEIVVNEMWVGRSPMSGSDRNRCLRRWNAALPVSMDNVVLLTRSEAEKHEALSWDELSRTQYFAAVQEKLENFHGRR